MIERAAGVAEVCGEDLGGLYAASAPALRRLVADGMRLPDAVVDDACQTAWLQLVRHRRRVARRGALGWLVQTAVHEAYRHGVRAEQEVSLEALGEREDEEDGWESLIGEDRTDELALHITRVDALRGLRPRQQRFLWLLACGLSYREIAAATGDSERTVERQLLRARERLARLDARG